MRWLAAFFLAVPFLAVSAPVLAMVSADDDEAIVDVLVGLQNAVTAGDAAAASSYFSPEASNLANEVRTAVMGSSITYALDCAPWNDRRIEAKDGTVTVSCTSAIKGVNWNASGLAASFTLAKDASGQWLITDTDFHTKLNPGAVFSEVGGMIMPILLLAFVICVFWLWMIIDCLRRSFNEKGLWIALLLFLGPIGAVLYFFIVKRKNVKA